MQFVAPRSQVMAMLAVFDQDTWQGHRFRDIPWRRRADWDLRTIRMI